MKYIDLGLHSDTLWADTNEEGYYEFNEAVEKFGDALPTKEQWNELKDECIWEWNGNGYNVVGPNGNKIVLPAKGYRYCNVSVYDVGSYGSYWSSAAEDSDYAWYLDFDSGGAGVYYGRRCYGFSVRLVKK